MEGKEERKQGKEEKKLMQTRINRPILPVLSDEIFTDREDLLALLKLRAMNSRFQRTMSFALLGHRRVGKT